jgi:asparagine synthase (glutamine-hydrolysing)
MSAIAALLSFLPQTQGVVGLTVLLQSMAKRSPDGSATWSDDRCSLGVGLLDRSTDVVPVTSGGRPRNDVRSLPKLGECHIAWDGRLDNRAELLTRIDRDRSARTPPHTSDAHIALALYHAMGSEFVPLLLGDFAFAIWDSATKQLFCARDAMGARPFYYTSKPDFFALASEDDALCLLPGVSAKRATHRNVYARVPAFTAFDWSQAWPEDVRILMPGHSLTIDADRRVTLSRYWDWRQQAPLNFSSETEAVDAFGELMLTATRDRLRNTARTGVMLSGGVDSAVVAVSAAKAIPDRTPHFYSIVHDSGDAEIETRAIRAASQTLNGEAHQCFVPSFTGAITESDVRDCLASNHPIDKTLTLVSLVCLAASQSGQRTLLHGGTGDLALYADNDYFVRFARNVGLNAAAREAMLAKQHHTYIYGRALVRGWLRSAYAEFVPPSVKIAWRKLRYHQRPPDQKWDRLLGDRHDVAAMLKRYWADEQQHLQRSFSADAAERTYREHLNVLFPIGVVRGLEGYERIAGQYGIEFSDPFADRRVIEFCLRLPIEWRTRNGWTKWLARAWSARALPDVCVWRSDKTHLSEYVRANTD